MATSISQPINVSTDLANGGSGHFTVVRSKAGENTDPTNPFDKKDPVMRFKNSRDPVYIAFDAIDKQPISVLAKEFIQETISGTIQMISQVIH